MSEEKFEMTNIQSLYIDDMTHIHKLQNCKYLFNP